MARLEAVMRAMPRFAFFATSVSIVIACGGDASSGTGTTSNPPPPPPPPTAPGIRFVSGNDVTDTVQAVLSAPVIVEVRDSSGAVAPGRRVDFIGSNVLFSRTPGGGSPFIFPSSTDTTDTAGRAKTFVEFATLAGPATVDAKVASLGFADTAHMTVLPGAPAQLNLFPDDTALYVQHSFVLRTLVRDRVGNTRQDPIAYSAGPLAVSVSPDGRVTAGDIGRVYVAGRVGSAVDTTWVSIVPHGTIAAAFDCLGFSGLALMELDGSGGRIVIPSLADFAWSPDGKRIAYTLNNRVRVTDMNGFDQRVTNLTTPPVEGGPRYSVDGQWIWYSAGNSWPAVDLWRVRADLTTPAERIGPGTQPAFSYNLYWQPTAFPNGKVAFLDGGYDLLMLDLNTGAFPIISFEGHGLRYSPVRDLFAYLDYNGERSINVMRTDATGIRRVSPAGRTFFENTTIDWSPDGEWLLLSSASSELLNYETGLELPLKYPCAPHAMLWRPGS